MIGFPVERSASDRNASPRRGQDPAFASRTFVAVASKALSAVINDPTTVALALDQVHLLLRHIRDLNGFPTGPAWGTTCS